MINLGLKVHTSSTALSNTLDLFGFIHTKVLKMFVKNFFFAQCNKEGILNMMMYDL